MSKPRKSLQRLRHVAYQLQDGLCFYCNLPMWQNSPDDFIAKYKVSRKCAYNFKGTAEHLVPFSEGGPSDRKNIVAACRFCNSHRHMRKKVPSPESYITLVRKRVRNGRWNAKLLHGDYHTKVSASLVSSLALRQQRTSVF